MEDDNEQDYYQWWKQTKQGSYVSQYDGQYSDNDEYNNINQNNDQQKQCLKCQHIQNTGNYCMNCGELIKQIKYKFKAVPYDPFSKRNKKIGDNIINNLRNKNKINIKHPTDKNSNKIIDNKNNEKFKKDLQSDKIKDKLENSYKYKAQKYDSDSPVSSQKSSSSSDDQNSQANRQKRRQQKMDFRERKMNEDARKLKSTNVLIPGQTPTHGIKMGPQPRDWLNFNQAPQQMGRSKILSNKRIIDFTLGSRRFNFPRISNYHKMHEDYKSVIRYNNQQDLKRNNREMPVVKIESDEAKLYKRKRAAHIRNKQKNSNKY